MRIRRHKVNIISFCVYVDRFDLKYHSNADAHEFLDILGIYYKYTIHWTVTNFYGITFDWEYDKCYVDLSIQNYVRDILDQLWHISL